MNDANSNFASSSMGSSDTQAKAAHEGGDVALGEEIYIARVELSPDDLTRLGHKSVEEFLRADLYGTQGVNSGYNTGVNAKTSLNIGLSEAGRETFRDARKKKVAQYYAGQLLGILSKID